MEKLEKWKQEQIVKKIRAGAVFIYPTDTVYGIGCTVYNSEAVDRIFKIKGRSENKSFPILATADQVRELTDLGHAEQAAARDHWPGNLTMVLKLKEQGELDSRLIRDEQVALRVPDLAPLLELLEETGPVVGTSANFSGSPAAAGLEDVSAHLLSEVDLVLGESRGLGKPSTVAGWNASEKKWEIYREGELAEEQLVESVEDIV